jgi:hypothetical protein
MTHGWQVRGFYWTILGLSIVSGMVCALSGRWGDSFDRLSTAFLAGCAIVERAAWEHPVREIE